jgi:hypothetical protein
MRAPLHVSATDGPLPKFGVVAIAHSHLLAVTILIGPARSTTIGLPLASLPGTSYGAHSASDKPVRPTVSIEKLENLTIDAIAHRNETDHRIVQQLSGRALVDLNSLSFWPAGACFGPSPEACSPEWWELVHGYRTL